MAHTKGPWRSIKYSVSRDINIESLNDQNAAPVALVCPRTDEPRPPGSVQEKEQRDNARLIMASTDLLDALVDMVNMVAPLTDDLDSTGISYNVYRKAKEAIRKAI